MVESPISQPNIKSLKEMLPTGDANHKIQWIENSLAANGYRFIETAAPTDKSLVYPRLTVEEAAEYQGLDLDLRTGRYLDQRSERYANLQKKAAGL